MTRRRCTTGRSTSGARASHGISTASCSTARGYEVILTDANGTKYTYEVFKKFIVDPSELRVTQPVAGKSIITLQTCTLPDYKQRLIVQGELKSVS